jgi:enterochelin esterase-like enzyme
VLPTPYPGPAAGGLTYRGPMPGTLVSSDGVDFRFADAAGVQGVRLEVDFPLGPTDPEFRRIGQEWSLHLPRPALDRMEYQFTLRSAGGTAWTTDPDNPDHVPNPYGDKSEIRFPEYRPPAWTNAADTGTLEPVATEAGRLDAAVPTAVWSPDGLPPAEPAPMVLVHDGTDMAQRGALLRWAGVAAREQPFRVALLDPARGLRDSWYAADAAYPLHLAGVVLPAIKDRFRTTKTIGMGASLGALAMLWMHHRSPSLLQGLVLQSGSYFTPVLDPQESGYSKFARICEAVDALRTRRPEQVCPVLLTCGAVEENRANNEEMAHALTKQGYDVEMHLVPDAHTMIGWRDAWSPGLERLLQRVERG